MARKKIKKQVGGKVSKAKGGKVKK